MEKTNGFRKRAGKVAGGVARGAITAALVFSTVPTSALAEALTSVDDGSAVADAAVETNAVADSATQVTGWKDVYSKLGADTSGTYDVVTSATNFTSRHAGDIASVVNKVTDGDGITTLTGVNLSGKSATVTPKLSSASYNYSCNFGDGEFVIVPDEAVEGYTWNDFFDNAYAVTISNGVTTVGAVPWQDWYGEHATSGYHYNKFEIAMNNGTSKGSNEGNVNRFAAFYDEGASQIRAGKYTVTIYSEGYKPLVASDIQVLPTYTGKVTASDATIIDASTTISGLPADIANATATVTYTAGSGRRAPRTTLASGVSVVDGKVALDKTQLATVPVDASLSVTVSSSNYAPITTTATVKSSVGSYVLMNIPYSEFYATETGANTASVDVFTSATKSKPANATLAGSTYHPADNSQITGVTYAVKIGDDEAAKAFANYEKLDSSDALATAADHSYVILSDEPAAYKELTADADGNLTFGKVSNEDSATTISADAAQATLSTDAFWGDYMIVTDTSVYETLNADGAKIVGAVVQTSDGSGYGLRALGNIWNASRGKLTEFAWSTIKTEVHGCPTNNTYYQSIMGKTITGITVFTDKGTYQIETGNLYVPIKSADSTIQVEGTKLSDTDENDITVTKMVLPFKDPEFSLDGKVVHMHDNKVVVPVGTQPGSYTLTASDPKGTYADVISDSFLLTTDKTVAAYDAEGKKLVAADGASDADLANYISNISSVTVDGKQYNTGRRGTTIVKSDGSIDTTVTSGDSRIFDHNGTYTLEVASTGYNNNLTFEITVDDIVTSWKDVYADKGVDTSTGYDVVTSATNFSSRHAKDIATIVSKQTDADGNITGLDGVKLVNKTATVTPELSSATFDYFATRGDGEFVIVPDDTVEGYTWNEYLNNIYAVTVSDGTTTAGTVPWIDWYGENATSGYHYNKLEVALNNGESKGSNKADVQRFAAFYDENGNIKAGTYTVTVYADGYSTLTAQVTVLPTYTGVAIASDVAPHVAATTVSELPADIKNAKVTVSYTTGSGRNAKTTTYAEAVSLGADGRIVLDKAPEGDNAVALADLADGTALSVVVYSDNYAPITTTATVKVDRSMLDAAIRYAGNYRESRYTRDTWKAFADALSSAKDVNATTDATQQAVDDATDALNSARVALKRRSRNNGSSGQVTVTKTNLSGAINRAKGLKESDYTASSWKALQDALAAAQKVYDSSSSTQAQVNAAVDSVNKAVDALVKNTAPAPTPTPTPTPTPSPVPFPDVNRNAWYAPGVNFCRTRGIITGYADGRFGVGDPLTRGQFATILWRIAEPEAAAAYDINGARNQTGFADVRPNAFYTGAANWAVENGIILGYGNPDGSRAFGPDDLLTPEQMAAILARYVGGSAVDQADQSTLDGLTDSADISDWARQPLAWLRSTGLIEGYQNEDGSRTLRPQENIARERTATIIMRAYEEGLLG